MSHFIIIVFLLLLFFLFFIIGSFSKAQSGSKENTLQQAGQAQLSSWTLSQSRPELQPKHSPTGQVQFTSPGPHRSVHAYSPTCICLSFSSFSFPARTCPNCSRNPAACLSPTLDYCFCCMRDMPHLHVCHGLSSLTSLACWRNLDTQLELIRQPCTPTTTLRSFHAPRLHEIFACKQWFAATPSTHTAKLQHPGLHTGLPSAPFPSKPAHLQALFLANRRAASRPVKTSVRACQSPMQSTSRSLRLWYLPSVQPASALSTNQLLAPLSNVSKHHLLVLLLPISR